MAPALRLSENAVANPWIRQNPWMSLWLSGFNTAGNTARAHATIQMQRYYAALAAEGTRQWMRYWSGAAVPAIVAAQPATRRPRKSRR